MNALKVDCACVGNHDFDFGATYRGGADARIPAFDKVDTFHNLSLALVQYHRQQNWDGAETAAQVLGDRAMRGQDRHSRSRRRVSMTWGEY